MLKKLKKNLFPEYIKIYDNTMYHKMKNQKKHITMIIVSHVFKNQKILMSHQSVYKLLSKEMKNIIYAISMHMYTPEEWKGKKYNSLMKCYNK